jgi:hypothetical protein
MRDCKTEQEIGVDFEIDPVLLDKAAPGDFSVVRDAMKEPMRKLIYSFVESRIKELKGNDDVYCEEEWSEVDEAR